MSIKDNSTYSLQVVQGSSSVSFTSPNLFTLQLPSNGFTTGRDEVSLKNLNLYYSWANVTALKKNNSWSYKYQGVSYPIVMADGSFSFADLNAYLQGVMVANGHYLVDQDGNQVTFLSFTVNTVFYCLSLTAKPVPSVLPAGWTNPAGMVLSGVGMQLVVPATMSSLTGFAAGSYPPAPLSSTYQVNSGVPQITDATSINVISNIVNSSNFALSRNILASFVVPNGQTPGSQIQFAPMNLDFIPMQASLTFTQIEIAIVDQLQRPIVIRDPSGFLATLSIRRRQ